ncbi:MAG: Iron-sulfur cluster regulator IscR [Myxococcaceae bacterium]|nr:Iron-sulfur cluster regulator IscR [Myxococcaceae bacterium]
MKLSNKGRYGVRALFDLAFHGGGTSSQIREIAERQSIPPRFLEQIFQDLRRAGLVSSKRGPRGGYQLTRAPREVSLGDVIRALEGKLSPYTPEEDSGQGDPASIAVTETAFRELAERIEACFETVTLEDLCQQAEERGVHRGTPGGYVYVI